MSLGEILDGIVAILHKYIVLTNAQASTIALVVAHTWVYRASNITPYLNIRSAIKRSGKSSLLELVMELVWQALKADNISTAVVAHVVDRGCTLLIDEADRTFYSKNRNEELIGICNSGYRSKGKYARMVGQGTNMEPHFFSTFGPKVFAGIRGLPDTMEDRSIVVDLKRKATSEIRAEFLLDDVERDCKPLHDQLALWSAQATDTLRNASPDRPQQLNDRQKDSWRPLLAIANMQGERWSKIGWDSALELSGFEEEDNSLEIQLLRDIKDIFERMNVERLYSSELVEYLRDLEESPWANWRSGGMTTHSLGWYLKPFGIRSKQIRIGDGTKKGYKKESFVDAWTRYLSLSGGDSRETSETLSLTPAYEPNETITSVNGNVSDSQQIQLVPDVSDVSVQSGGGDQSDDDDEFGHWTIDDRGVWFRTSRYGYKASP